MCARLRSLLLVPGVAAFLTIGCGQGNPLVSPTAPTPTLGSTALSTDGIFDASVTASGSGDFTALGRGRDKGNGGGNSSDAEHDRGRRPEHGGNHHHLSGFVTAVNAASLTVRGITVMIDAATVVRHGHRILTVADIQVGDHVQARGILDGTSLVATEVKVEDTRHDNDDDEDEEDMPEVTGAVSGLTGTCPALTFTVGTTRVTTTTRTEFEGLTCATLANGAMVEVEGRRQADGSLVANKLELDAGPDEVEGRVSGLIGECPTLTFTIGVTRVTTSSTTAFTGVACAAIVNGTRIEVEGTRQDDGSLAAATVDLD